MEKVAAELMKVIEKATTKKEVTVGKEIKRGRKEQWVMGQRM
jgi:hypothetical protein